MSAASHRRWRIGEPDMVGYDLEQDERWGSLSDDDHITGTALPTNYQRFHRSLVKGGNAERTRDAARVVPSPSHTRRPVMASSDGRGGGSTLHNCGGSPSPAAGSGPRGDVTPSHHRDPSAGEPSSGRPAVADGLTEQTRPAGRPSAS